MIREPSTRSLEILPDIAAIRRVSQSVAMLDAILSPDWEVRYYSFNAAWGPDEQMASMRNGSGDEYFILFNSAGAVMKGFDHEAPMTPYRVDPPRLWRGLYEGVPAAFESFLREPAFSIEEATFCIWRLANDSVWRRGVTDFADGSDPDGSQWMLKIFDLVPTTYRSFAEEYYEVDVPIKAVEHIYNHLTLTDDVVAALNPDLRANDLVSDAEEIGYPNRAS